MDSDPRLSAIAPRLAQAPPPHARPTPANDDALAEVSAETTPSPINYRVLVFSALLLTAVTVAISGLHHWQVRRIANRFREWGIDARNRGDAQAAIDHLKRYLAVGPGDTDAILNLACSIEETAKDASSRFRALQLFERILRESPDSADIRRRLVGLHIQFGRDRDAIEHLKRLLDKAPSDAGLLRLLGECHERLGNYPEAMCAYQLAIESAPRDLDSYRRLVHLQAYRLDAPDEAANVLNELVRRNPSNADAYLMRADFRLGQERLPEARIDAVRAYRLDPKSPQVCGLITNLLAEGPWPTIPVTKHDLRSTLSAVAEQDDDYEAAALALVQLDLLDGQYVEAEGRIQRILEINPESQIAWILHADVLTLQGNLAEAKDTVAGLESRLGRQLYLSDLLKARTAMLEGEWQEAARLFQRVHSHDGAPLALRTRAGLCLADCYQEMGDAIHQHETYVRVVAMNPLSAEAVKRLAASHWRMGQFEEAVKQYGRLSDDSTALAAIAQIMIEQNRRLPPTRQRWDDVERAIQAAAQANGNSTTTVLLTALALQARNQLEEAVTVLQKAIEVSPGNQDLQLLLVDVFASQKNWSAADEALDELEHRSGKTNLSIGARIQLAAAQGDLSRLTAINGDVGSLPDERRLPLLRTLAAGYLNGGDADRADRCWDEIERYRPYDLAVKRYLFKNALRQGDDGRCQELVGEMREIEGVTGAYSQLAEASRLLALAQQGKPFYLDDARRILVALDNRLPDSSDLKTELGDVCLAQGDIEGALEQYSGVVNRLVPTRHCVLQMARLLYEKGEFAEVGRLIRRFENMTYQGIGPQLAQLGTVAAIEDDQFGEALRFAEIGSSASDESMEQQLWLGHVNELAGRTEQAEACYRRATELAPDRPAAWIAYAGFLAASKRTAEVFLAIDRAKSAVAESDVDITLAQCYDAAGLTDKATLHFERVVESRVSDSWQLVSAVRSFVRTGDVERAMTVLRGIVHDPDGHVADVVIVARRLLANLLASSSTGGYAERQTALNLIDDNLADEDSIAQRQDLLLKARILAGSPLRADHWEAIHIWESLPHEGLLSIPDLMLLSQLYHELNHDDSAAVAARQLAARSPHNPDVLAAALKLMLDLPQNEPFLEDWVERLLVLRPDDPVTITLNARWLCRQGRTEEALAAVEAASDVQTFNATDSAARSRCLRLAVSLDDMAADIDRSGLIAPAESVADCAERLYRALAEDDPTINLYLSHFFIRRWRLADALETCHQMRGVVSAERLAPVYIQLLRRRRLEPAMQQEIQQWLHEQCEANPQSSGLLLANAHALSLSGEYEAALLKYRGVLTFSPDNVEALNEAALLMALTGRNLDEALEFVDRALRQAGPAGFLLDTRATVELAMGLPLEAIRSAEASIAESPTSVRYFHLAQAQQADGRQDLAKKALQDAIRLGLHTGILHPLEIPDFQQLQRSLSL